MKIHSTSADETARAGKRLAGELVAGDVLALVGDLGAGKTSFVRGLAEGLKCNEDASSPTFTLINEYMGGLRELIHADLYRLRDADHLYESGLAELMESDAIVAVEWADRFPAFFPEKTRWLYFSIGEGETRIIEERSAP